MGVNDAREQLEAAKAECVRLERAAGELIEAIRLTVEYVGLETLPPIVGWSWFDALTKHAPELARHFFTEAVKHQERAAAKDVDA